MTNLPVNEVSQRESHSAVLWGQCASPLHFDSVVLISAPDGPMAGVTRRHDSLIVHETILGVAVRRMAGVARDASPGVGVSRLPARQELMPVTGATLVFAFARSPARNRDLLGGPEAALGHVLVAFQAGRITNRRVDDRRLDGGSRKPLERVLRAHQLSRNPSRHPWPGMTVDAERILSGVMRSQIDGRAR
jgi:hypothetical protein